MKRWHWIGVALVVLVSGAGIALVSFPTTTDRNGRSHDSVHRSRTILLACEAYRSSHNNRETEKKLPSTLADLVVPPFGGSSFLPDGKGDTIDPWGNPYRYAVISNAAGEEEVYVWSERRVDGKLKLLGAKMRVGGEIEYFGLAQ